MFVTLPEEYEDTIRDLRIADNRVSEAVEARQDVARAHAQFHSALATFRTAPIPSVAADGEAARLLDACRKVQDLPPGQDEAAVAALSMQLMDLADHWDAYTKAKAAARRRLLRAGRAAPVGG